MTLLDISDANTGDLFAVIAIFLFALLGLGVTLYWLIIALTRWVDKITK